MLMDCFVPFNKWMGAGCLDADGLSHFSSRWEQAGKLLMDCNI
jgi:hypothetical protein